MRKLEEWIDFMEGECDSKQASQLGLLLKHSLTDQTVLDNLRRLRRMVKASDRALEIEAALADEALMADLHAQTMKRLTNRIKMQTRHQGASAPSDQEEAALVAEAAET